MFCIPGYISGESPDSPLVRDYPRELTRVNHYANGSSPGAYPANGYSSDWFYENPPSLGKTFPFLSEVGGEADGFCPATSRILPIATENLRANLFSAWAGGAYVKLRDAMLADSSGDGDLEPERGVFLQDVGGDVCCFAEDHRGQVEQVNICGSEL